MTSPSLNRNPQVLPKHPYALVFYSILILLFFFGFSPKAAATEWQPCASVTFKIPGIPTKTESAPLCLSKDNASLVSHSCVKGCLAFEILEKRHAELGQTQTLSSTGTPGANLCKAMGGVVQIIEIPQKSHPVTIDRCIFSKDGSFIDSPTLFALSKMSFSEFLTWKKSLQSLK